VCSGETRTRAARREDAASAAGGLLISHSSLCEEVLARTGPHHSTREINRTRMRSGSGKCSGFWHLANARDSSDRAPSSRLHPGTEFRDWLSLGRSYPVTAAQLLPIYTEFLPAT